MVGVPKGELASSRADCFVGVGSRRGTRPSGVCVALLLAAPGIFDRFVVAGCWEIEVCASPRSW